MIKQATIAAALTLLLFASGFFAFASAVPVFYLYCCYKRKPALFSAALSALGVCGLLLFKKADVPDALYLVYLLMIGVVLGECVLKKAGLFKMVATSVVLPCSFLLVSLIAARFAFGIDVVEKISGYYSGALDQALKLQEGIKSLTPAQSAYLKENSGRIAGFVLNVTPSLVLLFTMFISSLTVLIGRGMTKRIGTLKYMGNVAAAHFPFWPVWLAITGASVFFAESYLFPNEVLRFAALNGLFFAAGIFFIEGCFVVSFFLHKGRSPFLKLLVYGAIIMFVQVMGFVLIALGLSDQWLGFREKHLKQTAV